MAFPVKKTGEMVYLLLFLLVVFLILYLPEKECPWGYPETAEVRHGAD